MPSPSASARSAASWAAEKATIFSEIIRSASTAAFGAALVNSMSRAEITPCASHVKRTASIQLAQKSTMAVSDRSSEVREARNLLGARSEEDEANFLKLPRGVG